MTNPDDVRILQLGPPLSKHGLLTDQHDPSDRFVSIESEDGDIIYGLINNDVVAEHDSRVFVEGADADADDKQDVLSEIREISIEMLQNLVHKKSVLSEREAQIWVRVSLFRRMRADVAEELGISVNTYDNGRRDVNAKIEKALWTGDHLDSI